MTEPFSAVEAEADLVWLEDPNTLPYVREIVTFVPHRARKPSKRHHSGRLVGYATVRPNTPGVNCRFRRRIFWLAKHDRDSQPNGVYRVGAPCEAVDPLTVAVGVAGKMTPRAWGKGE